MKEIRSLILSLGKNKTILLSSHIMQEVEAMCSRVIILNKGKIIADDTIEAIKKNWDMNTIQTHVKFRDSVNGAELSLIDGVESIKSVDEKTFVIVSKGNVDIAEELFNFAIASNTIIVEQKEQEKSLESIFQKLTNHA
jgi:ABC-2 type transport system ATP-binding protein